MKIAILLCGNIRSWDKTKESFDNFFKNIEYDLFVSTYTKQCEYHPYWLGLNPLFQDVTLEKQNINNLLLNKSKAIVITDSSDNDIFIENERLKMNPKMKDYFHGFSQFNNIKKAINIMEEYEISNNFKYDIVIKTRFDVLYNSVLNIQNIETIVNEILIDSNNTYPNDWFFIIRRNNINDFVDFLINEYYLMKYENSNQKPPHGVFENGCKHNNLVFKTNNYITKIIRNF